MQKSEIKSLLKKYLDQQCSKEELFKFWGAVSENQNETVIHELLFEDLENFMVDKAQDSVDFDRIFKNIEFRINQSDKQNNLRTAFSRSSNGYTLRLLKVAVVLLIFFIGGGVLSYFIFTKQEEPTLIAYNEVSAPLGARSEVRLPDGSTVWLNAGSKIKYLNVFNKENRNIMLVGEAYFKVAKNHKLPFMVHTGDLNIVATGTEFNVKAYEDEGTIETTLIEGKVTIRQNKSRKQSDKVLLEPHQKAVYVREDRKLSVEDHKVTRLIKPERLNLKKGVMYVDKQVDPEPIISWKENRLILKGEALNNLLIKLERKYDVSFTYDSDNIRQFRFTGTLEDETLTQVLDVIKLSAPIDYRLDGKTVEIFENEQMSKKFSGHLRRK